MRNLDKVISRSPKSDSNSLRKIVLQVKHIMEMASDDELAFATRVDIDANDGFYRILRKYCNTPSLKDFLQIVDVTQDFIDFLGALKMTYRVERPYVIAQKYGISLPRKNLVSKTGYGYSYPSIHAGSARFLANYFAERYKSCLGERGRYDLYMYANAVAVSRVHLGVHSLQDIQEGIRLADLQFTQTVH